MFQILVAEDDKNTRRLMEAVLKLSLIHILSEGQQGYEHRRGSGAVGDRDGGSG